MSSYAGPAAPRPQDIAGSLRLLGYLGVALVLMVADHREGWLHRMRLAAEFAVQPLWKVAGMPAQLGDKVCTPWASDSGGWSAVATDADGVDADAYRITVETRPLTDGSMTRDFRVGMRGLDEGGAAEAGHTRYSPWASQGGGWSSWASDDDERDPDGFALLLELRP